MDEIDRILDRLVKSRVEIIRAEFNHVLAQHQKTLHEHAAHLIDLEKRQREDEAQRRIAELTLEEVRDLKRLMTSWARDRGGPTDG